jgi:hypothetical protein
MSHLRAGSAPRTPRWGTLTVPQTPPQVRWSTVRLATADASVARSAWVLMFTDRDKRTALCCTDAWRASSPPPLPDMPACRMSRAGDRQAVMRTCERANVRTFQPPPWHIAKLLVYNDTLTKHFRRTTAHTSYILNKQAITEQTLWQNRQTFPTQRQPVSASPW